MKELINFLRRDKTCRRALLMTPFGYQPVASNRHSRCDICKIACECGEDDCKSIKSQVERFKELANK